ncbi:hypothetical protein MSG28_007546 [Choristoneura fumiferana]|uniref:Uncharacterized protein n=1 Tax=Choristoneura fumiferana TaxID=7141 RepID=A0ACC0JY40_CHOFU|nr:hypothetical protein MSG28_007546 [Choristoneura fumiferana]
MELLPLTFLTVVLTSALAAPASEAQADKALPVAAQGESSKDDLNTAASNYWGNQGYGGHGTGVTGYGLLDDKYNNYQGGIGGYENSFGYNGYSGPGYNGYSGGLNKGYGYTGFGNGGYSGYGGNGGYGGYGGNGGLTSYYGYNNPYNQGAYHLGYGYYNKRPGYGNIYGSGITPSLVTGYRGYTR